MTLEKLIKKFEERYPKDLAEQWDNVGLLVGNYEQEVTKVLCCLDVTSKVIDYASRNGVDLIISHHPMIFEGIKKITTDSPIGSRIIEAISSGISVYAAHTNLDSATDGLNEYVISLLDLDFKYIFEEYTKGKPMRFIELDYPLSIRDVADRIKACLGISSVRIVSDEYYTSDIVRKIAIVTGSGMSLVNEVKDKVDLFITADVKHHEALDALELGLPIIDFGHHESESPSIELIANFLKELEGLEVIKYHNKSILEVY